MRIVTRKEVEKAYSEKNEELEEEISLKDLEESVDNIPEEIFEIIGGIVAFLDHSETNKGEKE